MKIKIDSEITIFQPTKEIFDYCKNELTIPNPDIQKKKAMGFWTGNLPKEIRMYTMFVEEYYRGVVIPIGCIDDIWKIHPIKEDYIIDFGEHKRKKFPENKITPYPYQEKAIQAMIKAKRGILNARCGSGKSIMALEIIRRIGYKALIICHTKELLNQFKDYLVNDLGMQKGDYGIIASGKVEIGNLVTIALRQTIVNVDLFKHRYEWGTIVVDECHNIAGNVTYVSQYQKILSHLAAEYRFGLSATAFRADGLTKCMFALTNKVKYVVEESEIADKIIKAVIQPIYTDYKIPEYAQNVDGTLDYTKMPTVLAEDKDRNKLILDLLKENKDNYCLVLSDRLTGLKQLHEELGEGLLIDGSQTTKAAKKEREEAIEKMRNKEEHYLFATLQLAREGLDIRPLNRLFLIAPTKNKGVLIQAVGRIERKDTNKQTPIVYDFVDKDIYYEKAFKSRKTIYKKNGNKILNIFDTTIDNSLF